LHVFDFLGNSILKEVLSAIQKGKPGAFSPGKPKEFLKNYKASLGFLDFLEGILVLQFAYYFSVNCSLILYSKACFCMFIWYYEWHGHHNLIIKSDMRWGCYLKHLDVFWVLDSAKVPIMLVIKLDYSVSFSSLCCTKARKVIYLHFQMFMWVFRIMLDLSFCRLLSIQVCCNKVPL